MLSEICAGVMAVGLLAGPVAKAQGVHPPAFFLLQAHKEGPSVQILLNDVPVESLEMPGADSGGTQVNLWIRPGVNHLRIVPLSPKGEAPKAGKAEVTLVKQAAGQTTTAGRTVITLTWKSDGVSRAGASKDFTVTDAPPAELWGKSKVMAIDEGARHAIVARVAELHAAIAKRDMGRVAALLDFKGEDIGRAAYMKADEARASQREFLEWLRSALGEAGAKLEPLEPDKLTLEPMADGQLVQVSQSGRPAIQIFAEGGQVTLPVYVGYVGGAWQIVR